MTTETLPATVTESIEEGERKRKLALLKAVGLDRVAPEQRELALAIAKRYDLDLLLKHLVLIEGRPYITRDALLWIAHRSGQFDGITVTRPLIEGDYWYAEATVYRKDMSHPFVYGGRYPTKGGNAKFAPEMAVKVAESMALRRAFNVSAPSADERWDAELPVIEPEPPKSLAEKAAEKVAAVADAEQVFDGEIVASEPEEAPAPKAEAATTAKPTTPTTPTKPSPASPSAASAAVGEAVQCGSISKLSKDQCRLAAGHPQMLHRTENEAWTDEDAVKGAAHV